MASTMQNITPLSETACGMAFEVKVKDVTVEKPMTQVRARLESYGTNPLPSLLRSRHAGSCGLAQQDMRVDKARKHNEQQKEITVRQKEESTKVAEQKRAELQQQLEKASEKRDDVLASRKSRAGQHFESVRAKADKSVQQHSEAVTCLNDRLYKSMDQKIVLRNAGLAERSARAAEHNEDVQEKKCLQDQVKKRQTLAMRSKPAAERLALLTVRVIEHYYMPKPSA